MSKRKKIFDAETRVQFFERVMSELSRISEPFEFGDEQIDKKIDELRRNVGEEKFSKIAEKLDKMDNILGRDKTLKACRVLFGIKTKEAGKEVENEQ